MILDEITNKAQKQSGFVYGNINQKEVVGEINPNDEYYTPKYAITPLLKYLKPNSFIWCPFDTEDSNFVKLLKESGHKVVCSHIFSGQNFFECNVEKARKFDYIISNPPYSLKFEVFKKLFEIGVPFAMLVGVVGLFESQKRFNLFAENDVEVMYFNKRVSFFQDYADAEPKHNPPFSSVYLCHKILPKQIVFEIINK